MKRKEKAYCEQCIHYSARKRSEVCAKATTFTRRGTATYLHPDIVRKEACWEKNENNKCEDFEKKAYRDE